MEASNEIYPIPVFVSLSVKDIHKSLDWYKQLGFSIIFESVGNGGELNGVHVRLGKYQDFNIVKAREGIPNPGMGVKIYLLKEISDIDAYAKELKAKGVNIIEGPVDRPWNLREIVISDPDGYRFVFSQVINMQMNFEEVVKQMREKSP